jgi:hypothetical protein
LEVILSQRFSKNHNKIVKPGLSPTMRRARGLASHFSWLAYSVTSILNADAQHALGAQLASLRSATLTGALALWVGVGWPHPGFARVANVEPETAEVWALSQTKQGKIADFNIRCGTTPPIDRGEEEDLLWEVPCRKLSAAFIEDMVKRDGPQQATPSTGVRITGARIIGSVNLENAKLPAIEITKSRIDGTLKLRRAHTESMISLDGSIVKGAIDASGLHSGHSLSLDRAIFAGIVDLQDAKIGGKVSMRGASFDRELKAEAFQVDGRLDMSSYEDHQTQFKEKVTLRSARVGADLRMDGASFGDLLDVSSVLVGGFVDMGGLFDNMRKPPVEKQHSSFNEVLLDHAKISGVLKMTNATFTGKFSAYGLRVGGFMAMKDTRSEGEFVLAFAKIDNNLDLRDATLASIDLSGASIAEELQLASNEKQVHWSAMQSGERCDQKNPPESRSNTKPENKADLILNLRNAHVGTLMDTDSAWPPAHKVALDGASFNHLGASEGSTEMESLHGRGVEWWDKCWARLNPNYSPSPYSQLAAAFTALGDRDGTNEIRYRARERERQLAWDERKPFTWFLLSVLWAVAGYGIGYRTFVVLIWVLLLSSLGAAILWQTVRATHDRHKGKLWCFGASLSRLLPVIEINKEFKDFFDDPQRIHLNNWQAMVFSALEVMGWLLGGVLLLAVSGLVQGV